MTQPAPEPETRFELEISPEIEPGEHADFASIWHTPDTFVLDFASLRQPPYLDQDGDNGDAFVQAPWGNTMADKVTTTATTREANVTAQPGVVYKKPRLGGVRYAVKPHPPTPRERRKKK